MVDPAGGPFGPSGAEKFKEGMLTQGSVRRGGLHPRPLSSAPSGSFSLSEICQDKTGRNDNKESTRAGKDPRESHSHYRWRDGHHDPHLRDDGGGYPRGAVQGLGEGPAEQRRPVFADPAEDDLRHPS